MKSLFARALESAPQICFVSGCVGTGKTSLVNSFMEIALEMDESVVAVYGDCNKQICSYEPYFPFLELIGQLTGKTKDQKDENAISKNASRLKK